jgi:hypothetical protein
VKFLKQNPAADLYKNITNLAIEFSTMIFTCQMIPYDQQEFAAATKNFADKNAEYKPYLLSVLNSALKLLSPLSREYVGQILDPKISQEEALWVIVNSDKKSDVKEKEVKEKFPDEKNALHNNKHPKTLTFDNDVEYYDFTKNLEGETFSLQTPNTNKSFSTTEKKSPDISKMTAKEIELENAAKKNDLGLALSLLEEGIGTRPEGRGRLGGIGNDCAVLYKTIAELSVSLNTKLKKDLSVPACLSLIKEFDKTCLNRNVALEYVVNSLPEDKVHHLVSIFNLQASQPIGKQLIQKINEEKKSGVLETSSSSSSSPSSTPSPQTDEVRKLKEDSQDKQGELG